MCVHACVRVVGASAGKWGHDRRRRTPLSSPSRLSPSSSTTRGRLHYVAGLRYASLTIAQRPTRTLKLEYTFLRCRRRRRCRPRNFSNLFPAFARDTGQFVFFSQTKKYLLPPPSPPLSFLPFLLSSPRTFTSHCLIVVCYISLSQFVSLIGERAGMYITCLHMG